MVIESGLTGKVDPGFQAFFNDPTNSLPIDVSWELFDKMLRLTQKYLPFGVGIPE
jgi:hypothetical protein